MNRSDLTRSGALVGLLMCGCFAQHGFGQTASPATANPEASAKDQLQEVIVTATRRETNLQTTPISVSALDSTDILRTSPKNIGDLAAFVPGFNVAEIPANNAAAFAIRGAGSVNVIVYFETPVAVLVDDFVMPSIQSQLLDTFDVDRVEVLRGPQGTLFGKNTTAGVVSIQTKKPNLEHGDEQAQLGYGSFGSWYAKAAADAPLISGKLALRAVFEHDKSDGYYKDGASYGPINMPGTPWNGLEGHGSGRDIGGNDTTNARLKLLFQATDNTDAFLQYQYLQDRNDGVSVNTTGPGPFVWNALGFPGSSSSDPLNQAGETDRLGLPIVLVNGVYLTINSKASFGTFTSVTGYWSQITRLQYTTTGQPEVIGVNGDPLSLFDLNRADDHRTFQQEVRFASSFEGPFNFVGGAFYQNDQIKFCVAQYLGFVSTFFNDNPYLLCSAQRANSYAPYGEATYKATDRLTLSAGVRVSTDDKTWAGRQQAFAPQITGNPATPYNYFSDIIDAADFAEYPAGVIIIHKSWTEPTYRFTASYQATDDIFTYFNYSHGYKAGGFNDQAGSFAAFGNDLTAFRQAAEPTNPEFANSYEAGAKLQTLENRLRLNVTGFFVDYSQLQENINVPIYVGGTQEQVTKFVNAASAIVKGIESEVTVLPTRGLIVRGVADYQDGYFKSFYAPGSGYDLATAPLGRTPRWQTTLDVSYSHPVGDWGEFTVEPILTHVSRNLFIQSIVTPAGNSYLDARTLLGLNVTLSSADETKYVKFIGRNLTDDIYKTGDYVVSNLWRFTSYGAPRYLGVELGAKF